MKYRDVSFLTRPGDLSFEGPPCLSCYSPPCLPLPPELARGMEPGVVSGFPSQKGPGDLDNADSHTWNGLHLGWIGPWSGLGGGQGLQLPPPTNATTSSPPTHTRCNTSTPNNTTQTTNPNLETANKLSWSVANTEWYFHNVLLVSLLGRPPTSASRTAHPTTTHIATTAPPTPRRIICPTDFGRFRHWLIHLVVV